MNYIVKVRMLILILLTCHRYIDFVNTNTDMFILFKDFDIRNIKIDQCGGTRVSVNVTCMKSTFYGCKNFNCDLSSWDVSNVMDTSGMFYGCKNFNCDLSSWDMPNVKNMYGMFHNCVIDDSHKPNFK